MRKYKSDCVLNIKKDPLWISFVAFIGLFTNISFISQKVLLKFELEKNGMDTISGDEIKLQCIVDRGKYLRMKIITSFLYIILLIALLSTFFICKNDLTIPEYLDKLIANLFPIISIILFAFSTIVRLGWAGMSYKQESVYEQLDERLFRLNYFFGALFALISILEV